MNDIFKNQDGCWDPTAGKAIKKADKIPGEVMAIIYVLRNVAGLAGFEINGRIPLREKATGKEYR